MKLSEWMKNSTVDDVLKAKPREKYGSFLCISVNDTIWEAMWLLGRNDIMALCVYTEEDGKRTYQYVLTINDILQKLRHYLNQQSDWKKVDANRIKAEFLERPVDTVVKMEASDSLPVFVQRTDHLCNLVNLWVEESSYSLARRVLIGDEHEVTDVLTMADFIHYCFVSAHQLPEVMLAQALPALYPGTKTPSPISSSSLVDENESAWDALNKLLDFMPVQVVGITDTIMGNLIGYLSSMDFMPSKNKNDIFRILASLPKPVASFVQNICQSPSRMIDAVTFRDHMTLEQLIERLLKMRVHMLWRIAFTGQVIGVVTAGDILAYFKRCSDLGL